MDKNRRTKMDQKIKMDKNGPKWIKMDGPKNRTKMDGPKIGQKRDGPKIGQKWTDRKSDKMDKNGPKNKNGQMLMQF